MGQFMVTLLLALAILLANAAGYMQSKRVSLLEAQVEEIQQELCDE